MKKTYKTLENEPAQMLSDFKVEYEASPDHTDDRTVFMKKSRDGISKKKLAELSEKTDISVPDFSGLLHISLRTIQRYNDEDLFDTHVSEHALMINKLYEKGQSLFGAPQRFNDWMKRPKKFFGDAKPVDMLDTFTGIDWVMEELTRIEHGVLA